jgi:hypothetical protein
MSEPAVAVRDTHHKALAINLDAGVYGTLAEIGAGQEVSRWFLQVGGASGTVAKTISAYDMTISDEIYGKVGRYVSRERLMGMLDREFQLLQERLTATKGTDARFFVFADTVSARNFAATNECHGWLGLRFQAVPGGEPNDVILHVNLKDTTNLLQQLAIGVLGVNLIYGCCYLHADLKTLLASLFDELSGGRVEIDLIHVSGPAFARVDGRAAVLQLVLGGFAEAVLFPVGEAPRPPSEVLRKRALVFEPGVFEEAQPIHARMLAAALREIGAEPQPLEREPVALFALTSRRPAEEASADVTALLHRIDRLLALGSGVIVLAHPEIYRLVDYAIRYTKEPIRLVSGIATIADVLEEQQYERLDGRFLEALSKLFAFNVRLYAYPMTAADFRRATSGTSVATWVDAEVDGEIDAQSLVPPPPVSHLYAYLHETGFLRSIPP